MDQIENVEVVGRVWDSITTPQKLGLFAAAVTILGSAIGLGYWLGTLSTANKLAAVEAKYERQLADLKSSSSATFVREFTKNDWQRNAESDYEFTVPYRDHRIDAPSATVQIKKDQGWEECFCGVDVDEFSNVKLNIGTTAGLDGRLVLK